MNFTCIDLFAGAGGFAEGFSKEGYEILVANDVWKPAQETYKANHSETKFILEDILHLSGEQLLKTIDLIPGQVDVITGGPPCQGFSTVGKRFIDDPRNKLFKEYVKIVQAVMPKIFVLENVAGLLSMQKGQVIKEIVQSFSEIGYKVEYRLLNAAEYGVPQIRERVIMIGSRLSTNIIFPEPTHSLEKNLFFEPVLSLWDAIGDLPQITANETAVGYDRDPQNKYQLDRRNNSTTLSHHYFGKHSEKLLKMMEYIPEGKSVWDVIDLIPEELIPTSGYGNTYARLDSKFPGMTITRNFGCISSSRCIHPFKNRGLTPREAARIQSFDDTYNFVGSKSDISLLIGNAVPPLLARQIAKTIKNMLKNQT